MNAPRLRVGLIGMGAIGGRVAHGLLEHAQRIEWVGALVQDPGRLAGRAPVGTPVITNCFDHFMSTRPDLVVECAGHLAVTRHGSEVLRAGSDLLLVSAGALADDDLLHRLRQAAASTSRHLSVVSGAIGGIDWLRAARRAGPLKVLYRSRKPPLAWRGSDAESLLDLSTVSDTTVFFRGSAREAARRFPRNANVAATLAFATCGLDAMQVELCADPTCSAARASWPSPRRCSNRAWPTWPATRARRSRT
jgi:aspartate dehydrogenase